MDLVEKVVGICLLPELYHTLIPIAASANSNVYEPIVSVLVTG